MFLLQRILLTLVLLPSFASAAPTFDGHYSESFDDFSIELLISGFDASWGLAYLPSNALLISEWKTGRLYHADLNTRFISQVASIKGLSKKGQGGFLDVLVDNNFSYNRRIYFSQAAEKSGVSTTQLWSAQLNKQAANNASNMMFWKEENTPYHLLNVQLLFEAKPWLKSQKHFAGAIAQDEKGDLYISVGDRGQRLQAQSKDSHLGKIIKLSLADPHRKKAFLSLENTEIYSLGHRNPQGLYYRVQDNSLWSTEHGPKGGDEINIIEKGANYGWPFVTQGKEYSGEEIHELDDSKKPIMQPPALVYSPSLALSTLAFYAVKESDTAISALQQHFILLSLKAKQLRLLKMDQGELQGKGLLIEHIHERWRNISISPQGDIFILAESGKVYRIYAKTKPKS